MVNKKKYTLSLDKAIVENAQRIMRENAQSMSAVVNLFLTDWIKKNAK